MQYKTGNLMDVSNWTLYNEVYVTANSTIRNDGCLVMGRGIAAQLKELYPTFPRRAAKALQRGLYKEPYKYGILTPTEINAQKCTVVHHNKPSRDWSFGLFQVKNHFRAPGSTRLIEWASILLARECTQHPSSTYALNYPGIGFGHLLKSIVQPILDKHFKSVPNLTIWTLK